MQTYRISKTETHAFFNDVRKQFTLIAPVKKDVIRFQSIETPEQISQIYLEKNSYFPIKEYFFRKREVLFKFKNNQIKEVKLEAPSRVFFGIRRCDLNAIHHQDKVFTEQVKDPYYAAMRENAYLIGYHCNEAPSQYCFCGTLNLIDFYDLMFYEKGDPEYFTVEVGSEKGQLLINTFIAHFQHTDIKIPVEDKKIKNADRLLKTDISKLYDHKDWKKGVDQCLSCAACTNLCPTCYCSEFHDEVSTKNLNEGERVRKWSSCQLQEFTQVAGGHVFREKREDRFKHRIYHQLDYFKEKNGIDLCVGCGRCIEGCPTRIDFVEIINEMK